MAASDSLSPVQFHKDDKDSEYARRDAEKAGDYVNDIYDPSDLREDQYARLSKDQLDTNPKHEAM